MTFGSLGSFNEVRRAVHDGEWQFAVNRLRPIQLARASEKNKLLSRLLYCMRFTVPTIVSAALALTVYPSSLAWVAVSAAFLISYFFDVRDLIVFIGLVLAAVGVTIHNNLLMLVGLPILASFMCGLVWWVGITRIAEDECLGERSKFRRMWESGLVLIITDDEVHSVVGSTKRNRRLI